MQKSYPLNPTVVNTPPAVFRLARLLMRKDIPGGWRLFTMARKLGMLDVLYRCPLSDRVSVNVPLFSPDDAMDRESVGQYESQVIDMVSYWINQMPGPVDLVDCGANIGLITARLVAACPGIAGVAAFEPNERIFNVLKGNVEQLPVEAKAHMAAVGNQCGTCELINSRHDPSDHARFIQPTPQGQIQLLRIDDLGIGDDRFLAIKIDVEGNELQVVEGAAETLARSRQFCIVFEAHPLQVERTGIEPAQIMRFIDNIRPCRFFVCEEPGLEVFADRDFFSQTPHNRMYNLFCRSTGDGNE